MYTCSICGEPTPNNAKNGYAWCDDCKAKYDRENAWENEQPLMESITCPWCGYEDPDSWEMQGERDEDYICKDCGKSFVVERDVSYSGYRKAEDLPEGWDGND